MKLKKEDLNQLIDRYLEGTATEGEISRLEGAYSDAVDALQNDDEPSDVLQESKFERLSHLRSDSFRKVADQIQEYPAKLHSRRYSWRLIATAASLVFAVSVLILYQLSEPKIESRPTTFVDQGISPGGFKATLSLSDGNEFELRSDQEAISIHRDSSIRYQDGTELLSSTDAEFATISVPFGGHYNLILPDGSTVYLNAGSKITYPITFALHHRTVELEGEAYFDIAHHKEAPFKVQTKEQIVQVLGTEFSIRAYESEATRTTLISGKVAVGLLGANRESWQELKPGQQFHHEGAKTQILSVDVTQFTAWKDGWFIYHDRPLNEALKEIARWYVLDLPSENIPTVLVNAEIHRTTPLDQVLQAMNIATGLTIQLEERRIMIRP